MSGLQAGVAEIVEQPTLDLFLRDLVEIESGEFLVEELTLAFWKVRKWRMCRTVCNH